MIRVIITRSEVNKVLVGHSIAWYTFSHGVHIYTTAIYDNI